MVIGLLSSQAQSFAPLTKMSRFLPPWRAVLAASEIGHPAWALMLHGGCAARLLKAILKHEHMCAHLCVCVCAWGSVRVCVHMYMYM